MVPVAPRGRLCSDFAKQGHSENGDREAIVVGAGLCDDAYTAFALTLGRKKT